MKIKILIPVYNDWQSASKLVDEINNLSINPKFQLSVIIVNDASTHDRLNEDKNLENIQSFKIINMKKNQGHARCIAAGLKHIFEKGNRKVLNQGWLDFISHQNITFKPMSGDEIVLDNILNPAQIISLLNLQFKFGPLAQ